MSDGTPDQVEGVSVRGDAAWKAAKEGVAERNARARKAGREQRQADDKRAADRRRAADVLEMAELGRRSDRR
jgi:hypothetical protein